MKRKFDRLPEFDERSRSFAAVSILPTKKLRNYTWPCNVFNDQGSEGACVGFSISHELAAIPFEVPFSDASLALRIYRRAQQIDVWPGENYEGTSVLAGMKAVMEFGFINEYRWGFGLEDMARSVGSLGPGVAGINWYSGMSSPDEKGFIHKTGFIQGGHAIMVRGVRCIFMKGSKDKTNFDNVDRIRSYFILHNSWGEGWGLGGTCKISFVDMEGLLHEQGEFVVPTLRTK